MIRLHVKPSRIKGAGNGVFTKDFVQKDDLIAEYTGEKKSLREVVDNGFLFAITESLFIDPSADHRCVIKYANDALGPVRLKGVNNNNAYWHVIGERVFVLADRDIYPHEEIFIGYGDRYWKV